MKKVFGYILIYTALIVSTIVFAGPLENMKARVGKIVELKSKGMIGEKPDGYLGVIKKTAESEKIVSEENQDRKTIYSLRAKKQGHPAEVIAKVLGKKRVEQENAGRKVWDASKNSWVEK